MLILNLENKKSKETNPLKNELDNLKKYFTNEIHILKNQNKRILERAESPTDKIRSFKDLKKELIAIFSVSDYSIILETNSFFKKLFVISCMLLLFSCGTFYVALNVEGYFLYGVVTQIEVKENSVLEFPAITFCAQEFISDNQIIPYNLNDIFISCNFEDTTCTLDDFELIQIYKANFNCEINCYKFNGGKSAPLLLSKKFGANSGITLRLKGGNYYIYYHVADNNVRPVYKELERILQSPKFVFVSIKKTVDIKLPEPYSRCQKSIDSNPSHLARQILERNITYRRTNCYDLCLNEYASARNISRHNSYKMPFDYQGNCSRHCPIECDSNFFEVSESVYFFDKSIHESMDRLEVNLFYSSNRYTEISQSIKTTESDLVSNTGGVLGLFLDFTFLSIYRFILNVLDLMFF